MFVCFLSLCLCVSLFVCLLVRFCVVFCLLVCCATATGVLLCSLVGKSGRFLVLWYGRVINYLFFLLVPVGIS